MALRSQELQEAFWAHHLARLQLPAERAEHIRTTSCWLWLFMAARLPNAAYLPQGAERARVLRSAHASCGAATVLYTAERPYVPDSACADARWAFFEAIDGDSDSEADVWLDDEGEDEEGEEDGHGAAEEPARHPTSGAHGSASRALAQQLRHADSQPCVHAPWPARSAAGDGRALLRQLCTPGTYECIALWVDAPTSARALPNPSAPCAANWARLTLHGAGRGAFASCVSDDDVRGGDVRVLCLDARVNKALLWLESGVALPHNHGMGTHRSYRDGDDEWQAYGAS
ncbi:hypothetical protein OAO87_00500, partial [bacterium]|nr:hypothetical protein [bacterium]